MQFGDLTNQVSDVIFWNMLLLLIISIFANLYMINARAQDNRGKRNGNSNNTDSFPQLLKNYLSEQYTKTINSHKQPPEHKLEKRISRLRSAYLKIEEKAADKGIDTLYYWAYLNAQVEKLFDIIADSKMLSPVSEMKYKIKAINEELATLAPSDNTRMVKEGIETIFQACNKPPFDPEKIKHYNSKLDDIYRRLCSSKYRNISSGLDKQAKQVDKCLTTTDKLQKETNNFRLFADTMPKYKNIGNYSDEVNKIKDNSKKMSSSVKDLDYNLDKVKKSINDTSNVIIAINNDDQLKEKIHAGSNLSDDLLEECEKEITRLQDVISNQKNTILELEDDLLRLELNEENAASRAEMQQMQEELQALQKNLRESEQCINILETELETLRELSQPDNILVEIEEEPNNEPIISEEEITELKDQIDDLQVQLQQETDEHQRLFFILNYIKEAFKSNSIEDIALLIYQTLQDMGYALSILIYTNGRTIELSKNGKINPKEKILINNMQAYEINLSSDALRISLKMPNIGGNIYSSKLKQLSEKDQECLVSFFEISDKIISDIHMSKASNYKKRNLDDVANKIKIATNDIDHTLDEVFQRIKNEVTTNFSHAQDLFRTKGANASQIARIKSYEKNAVNQIESETLARVKLKKKLLDVIINLENMESS